MIKRLHSSTTWVTVCQIAKGTTNSSLQANVFMDRVISPNSRH